MGEKGGEKREVGGERELGGRKCGIASGFPRCAGARRPSPEPSKRPAQPGRGLPAVSQAALGGSAAATQDGVGTAFHPCRIRPGKPFPSGRRLIRIWVSASGPRPHPPRARGPRRAKPRRRPLPGPAAPAVPAAPEWGSHPAASSASRAVGAARLKRSDGFRGARCAGAERGPRRARADERRPSLGARDRRGRRCGPGRASGESAEQPGTGRGHGARGPRPASPPAQSVRCAAPRPSAPGLSLPPGPALPTGSGGGAGGTQGALWWRRLLEPGRVQQVCPPTSGRH